MTTRLLRADEWDRIRETPLAFDVWRHLDASAVQIVIVEDEAGAIVACWATMACRHVEGFWVRPDHQKRGGTLRRLFVGMRELLTSLGTSTVLTQAETPEVAALLEDAGGTRMKGTSYYLPIDFGPWAKG